MTDIKELALKVATGGLIARSPVERRVSRKRGCEVSEFKREPRYVVFKIKDIHAYLKTAQIGALQAAGETIAVGRMLEGKLPFNAVVVEQDWPEFEMVWDAIEARIGERKPQR